MPLGWECRARLIKQVPAKPTERRGKRDHEVTPAPNNYKTPQLFGGSGYCKIKRAPAYTFGHLTNLSLKKASLNPNARMCNVQGFGNKGQFRITHGLISPCIEPVIEMTKTPGPAVYKPRIDIQFKRTPAYSMRPAAKPPHQPWDMWTPPPNMYHPPVPGKKEPAYTLGYKARDLKPTSKIPGPGEHDPNFNYVKKNKPAYSFGGAALKRINVSTKTPAPNTYCEKKVRKSLTINCLHVLCVSTYVFALDLIRGIFKSNGRLFSEQTFVLPWQFDLAQQRVLTKS